jgi:hypothetical protein
MRIPNITEVPLVFIHNSWVHVIDNNETIEVEGVCFDNSEASVAWENFSLGQYLRASGPDLQQLAAIQTLCCNP